MPPLFDKRDFLIRHAIIAAMSLLFVFIGKADPSGAQYGALTESFWRAFIWQFLFIASIWNGNLALIQFSPYAKWNWEHHRLSKIFLTAAIAMVWPLMVNYLFNKFIFPVIMLRPCDLGSKENIVFMIISVSITLFINTVFLAMEFFTYWRQSIEEKEALRRNTITAEFESLKSQVNPHFLFNALNTLSNLIEEEPKVASAFVQELSSVYRYLLSQKEKEVVSLGEELDFVKSYVFLNQIRFGQNLVVETKVAPEFASKQIVTLTLQMLLENAIKHNVISKEKPLHISIEAYHEYLCVRNNLQAKQHVSGSNGIGLVNIKSRYRFLSDREVQIKQSESTFEVCVPFL